MPLPLCRPQEPSLGESMGLAWGREGEEMGGSFKIKYCFSKRVVKLLVQDSQEKQFDCLKKTYWPAETPSKDK